MNKTFASLMLLAMILSTLPIDALGNSAPVLARGLHGVDVVPIRNDKIRMVKEVVNIDCAWSTYTVQVDFLFQNTSSEEQALQMGFPIDYPENYLFCSRNSDSSYQDTIRVHWNGKPVKHSLLNCQPGNLKEEKPCRQWIYWTTHFDPNEKATNRVKYTFPTWNIDTGDKDDKGSAYLKYILRTGAAWAGPIESSIIIISYNHKLPRFLIECIDPQIPDKSSLTMYPKGYVIDDKAHTVTWEFKDFVPDKDIYFGWNSSEEWSYIDKREGINIEDAPTTPAAMVK